MRNICFYHRILNLHFKSFPAKLVKQAGEYTGNTFKFLLVDSWECAFQNWTDLFPEDFEKMNGYSIDNWIPVLCGDIVENTEKSEAFLHDFRSTISSLIENNYYKHFSELCHQSGLDFHCEVIYGGGGYPPLDILKATSFVDMPMWEFWSGTNSKTSFIEYNPTERSDIHFPANGALFYNKPVVGSEAYTGYAHYSESPQEIKIYGDNAFCSGVNQMILHSYVHQPTETTPGMTLKDWGLPFNRHNPYWDFAAGWLNYQARIQYVLQNSNEVSDILFYVGDQLPQFLEKKMLENIPKAYKTNICNYDILNNKLFIKNGKIESKTRLSFALLILPEQKSMNFATLQLLEKLVKQGAIVYGKKPLQMLSKNDVENKKDEFISLSNKIWGTPNNNITEHAYGKGKVFWEKPISKVLTKINLKPDFSQISGDSSSFLFTHKKLDGLDYYFVVNQLKKVVNAKCEFRIKGKKLEIWKPGDGTISQITDLTEQNNNSQISYSFKPQESVFFVFKETIEPDIPIFKTEINSAFEINNFDGKIEFITAYKQKIEPVKISSLKPLSEFENDEIKYFSGKAKYTINFDVPDDLINTKIQHFLKLNQLESNAELILNNTKIADVWLPNQEFDISKIVSKHNKLEVTVAVIHRNRFIGDLIKYGKLKYLWTSTDINKYLNKQSPLKPTGLIGPIKIISYK